jgi:hypothetical protein
LFTKLLVVRQLQPWHENLAKRQVKSPKLYVRDSGLLHALLGVRTEKELLAHPKSGASWEGYVLEETLKAIDPDEAYFGATHQGAELDLLLFKGGRRLGIEIKRMDAPTLTASMRVALADLKLDQLSVIYPGSRSYELGPQVKVIPVGTIAADGIDGFLPAPRAPFSSQEAVPPELSPEVAVAAPRLRFEGCPQVPERGGLALVETGTSRLRGDFIAVRLCGSFCFRAGAERLDPALLPSTLPRGHIDNPGAAPIPNRSGL